MARFPTIIGAAPSGPPAGEAPAHGMIRLWLLLAAALVLLTLSIGGMTRLTNSGLSITEWEPIMGIVPPLTEGDWVDQFAKYKTTYEWEHVNKNMTLDEFRYIFNWEWRHRLVARLVFLAVFVPFIVLLLAGRLPKTMHKQILVVLGLIVLQGFIGWFMVQSGLRSDVRVSSYRLALHLGLASLLFAMLVALALGLDDRPRPRPSDLARSQLAGRILIGLLFALILFGALVAGLRGGRTHDTWPLMEGSLVPRNLFAMSPWLSNFFENPLTAQWVHRLLAYVTLITAVLHWRSSLGRDEPEPVVQGARWLLIGLGVQVVLGIVTVLNQVPIPLGLAHQLLAFLTLSLAIWHLYEVERHAAGPSGTVSWSETVTVPVPGPTAGPRAGRPAIRPPSSQQMPPAPTGPGSGSGSGPIIQASVATPAQTGASGTGSGATDLPVGHPAHDAQFPTIATPLGGERPGGQGGTPTQISPYRRPKLDS